MNEPMLKKAMDTLEFLSQDAMARMAYDARMKALSDEKTRLEGAREEALAQGLKQGIEQGIEQGKSEERRQLALKLLKLGTSPSVVAQATGFSLEQLEKLQSQES